MFVLSWFSSPRLFIRAPRRLHRPSRSAALLLVAPLSAAVALFLSGCGSIGLTHAASATTAGTSASSGSSTGSSGSSTGSSSSSSSGSSGSSGSGSSGSSGSSSGSSSSGNSGSGSGSSSGSSGSSSSGSGSSGSGSSGSGSSGSSSSGSSSGSSSSGSSSSSNAPAGTTLTNLQTAAGNWQSFSQIGPLFIDCASNCPAATWKQIFGIEDPSLSGNATQFELDPLMPYADVLYTAGVLGTNSPQHPDSDHTLLPTLHDFTYSTDFYVSDSAVSQALEFDVSLWMSGITGMTFGTQCNNLGDHDWDVWNNQTGHWTDSGAPCKFTDGWNHLTIQLERESNNYTLYKSITLNGTTYNINKDYPPISAPDGWWGVNINYQVDSNYLGSQVTTYLDNLSFTYQ